MIPHSELLDEIDAEGFAIVPSVIAGAQALELRGLLEQAIKEDLDKWAGKTYPDAWMVHNLVVRGMPFAHLLENATLQAYLCALLGDTCTLYAYTSSSLPPNGSNHTHRIHVDSPRLIPGYTTNVGAIVALDDFTLDNGATYFLPGSHRSPDVPSEEHFMANAKRVLPKRGDAVFFNARTFHMGGVNNTSEARHAVTMNVCRAYMRQRFDYPRLVPEEIVSQLSEVGRRFLGFHVRVPTSLDEYYLPEDQRLYKPGQG